MPVEALYDQEAAYGIALRNLLQRQGYADLEAVRAASEAEGEAKGRRNGSIVILLEQLTAKLGPLPAEAVARIEKASLQELQIWSVQVLTATTLEEALTAE